MEFGIVSESELCDMMCGEPQEEFGEKDEEENGNHRQD